MVVRLKRYTPKTTTTTVRLTDEMRAKLADQAKRQNTDASKIIVAVLTAHFAKVKP
jgi:hypothetical protein